MKASAKDQARGSVHVIKGALKQRIGRLTNNPLLEAKGRGEKLAGKVQRKMGQVKKVLGK